MDKIIIIVYIFFWFLSALICSIASLDLQEKKGYRDGSFFLGILLGVFYLIYSAGLPLAKDDCTITNKEKKLLKKTPNTINLVKTEGIDYVFCKKCGFPVYDDEQKCSNCGYPKDGFEKKETSSKSNKKD